MEENQSTEEKILAAAEEIFIRDGFDGARMQEIADKASINKALLHYYFRSKDKLFVQIFNKKLQSFFPKIAQFMLQDASFLEKVNFFIAEYMKMLMKNPFIPNFILNTANRNPDLLKIIDSTIPRMIIGVIEKEIEKQNYRKVQPLQFIVSIMGMCLMPFAGKPMIKHIFGLDDAAFQDFLMKRTKEVQLYAKCILEQENDKI